MLTAALGFRTMSDENQQLTVSQKTDILHPQGKSCPPPSLLPPASPTHIHTLQEIQNTKEPKSGEDPDMQTRSQYAFCKRRNMDPKRHSPSCRVDQWSCPPSLWPWGLEPQNTISNLQVHEAEAPEQFPHQQLGYDSRQMEWCWDTAVNDGASHNF